MPDIGDLTRTIRTKTTLCGCGCWVWTGAVDSGGYSTAKIKGRQVIVHRYVHDRLVGPIPDDMTIDHLCERHRRCINPEHFELVTLTENSIRANHRRHHGGERDRSQCTVDNPTQGETSS